MKMGDKLHNENPSYMNFGSIYNFLHIQHVAMKIYKPYVASPIVKISYFSSNTSSRREPGVAGMGSGWAHITCVAGEPSCQHTSMPR